MCNPENITITAILILFIKSYKTWLSTAVLTDKYKRIKFKELYPNTKKKKTEVSVRQCSLR